MTQKTSQNPWSMDVRVRERNLKSGALTDKDVEKHLAGLPDVAEQAEPFAIQQPALAHSHGPVADAGHDAVSDDDDDDDDEVDGDGEQ